LRHVVTPDSPPLIHALRDARAYPHPVASIELVETHISWVLLTGEYAYKVKKPVRFPFVDFSTLERRKRFCDDELRLNRRLAPELYLDVVPIGGSAERPRVGTTPAIEYAVRMRQFPIANTLDRWLDTAPQAHAAIREFADRLAGFHAELAPTTGEPVELAAEKNFAELDAAVDAGIRGRIAPLGDWTRQQATALRPRFLERERVGAIRECHGDLHLANLVWLDDRIVPFDCLEFDRSLRCIDTIDEVAFLTMDLLARGRGDLAFEFTNRYLEISGDYEALSLLRFYAVYRALVRCKVRALTPRQHPTGIDPTPPTPYLDLAERLIDPPVPVLVITHGYSGSGKTTFTNALIGALPAVRVRSDLERKRLHGLGPLARSDSALGGGLYARSASDATYAVLASAAGSALAAGFNAIVDAAFLERRRRDAFAELARLHGARFVVLSFAADEAELRRRVTARAAAGRDASEAGAEVLEQQLAGGSTIDPAEAGVKLVIDSTRNFDVGPVVHAILRTD
jgi:aminoglycoside phosphotransferase family enzyme/predicted kinase